MNKITLIIALAIILFTYSFNSKYFQNIKIENSNCNYGQRSAIKKDGYQCRNCAQQGSAYCWSHNR